MDAITKNKGNICNIIHINTQFELDMEIYVLKCKDFGGKVVSLRNTWDSKDN